MADNRPEDEMVAAEGHDEFTDDEDLMPLRNLRNLRNYLEDDLYLWEHELPANRLVAGRGELNAGQEDLGSDEDEGDGDPLQNSHTINKNLKFLCTEVVWTVLMHPLHHAGVLMQLGFEPFPGEVVRLEFLGPRNLLPGAQHLIGYIHQSDGFFGLYRGLTASIAVNVTSYVMDTSMIMLGPRTCKFSPTTGTSVQDVSWNLLIRSIRLALKLVLTQPLTVVLTRQIAQFIGCESVYKNMGQTIVKIFREEGMAGFYAGFVPRLLRKMGIMAVTTVATALFFHYGPPLFRIQAFHEIVVNISSSYVLHPLSVVGTCMDVQGSPLAAAMPSQMPHYEHWTKCFGDIYAHSGFYHRGGVLFWRTVPVKKLHGLMGRPN